MRKDLYRDGHGFRDTWSKPAKPISLPPRYVEMNCIGDYADFVVDFRNGSSWMVPGSERDRDDFGRKRT